MRQSGAPEVFLEAGAGAQPEQRSGTSRQVGGGAPRLLPFRLRFSDKLMLR